MHNSTTKGRLVRLGKTIWSCKEIYLLLLPGIIWYLIFAYVPMYGLTLAFKTFKANLGIFGSHWIGLDNFRMVFRDPAFINAVWRTLQINSGRLIFSFPFPILLAIMLNEVRLGRSKKILQTIYTFPHFLSWVLVASIMINVLGLNGISNQIIKLLGGGPVAFLATPRLFQPMVYITEIWKSAGWSAIIYMAAITGIDTQLYEAADIDGAGRLQKVWCITLPSIKSTVVIMFILAVGNLMTSGFDQLFNISNPATVKVAETLDMYIYRITFRSLSDYSFSSAVSLFKSAINFILLFLADRVSRIINGQGLFY